MSTTGLVYTVTESVQLGIERVRRLLCRIKPVLLFLSSSSSSSSSNRGVDVPKELHAHYECSLDFPLFLSPISFFGILPCAIRQPASRAITPLFVHPNTIFNIKQILNP